MSLCHRSNAKGCVLTVHGRTIRFNVTIQWNRSALLVSGTVTLPHNTPISELEFQVFSSFAVECLELFQRLCLIDISCLPQTLLPHMVWFSAVWLELIDWKSIQSNKIKLWFGSLTDSINYVLVIVCYFVILLIHKPHAWSITSKAVGKKKEVIIKWHVTQYVHAKYPIIVILNEIMVWFMICLFTSIAQHYYDNRQLVPIKCSWNMMYMYV